MSFNQLDKPQAGEITAVMHTTMGDISIRLFGDKVPMTVKNFVELSKKGYYDGLIFHRVIAGFMIQGGDPDSKGAPAGKQLGSGGPSYTLPAEFVYPQYFHKRGVLSAARQADQVNPERRSSGSQFYIVHDENACLHLDGQYSIFGEVVEGLEIIDRIATVDVDRYDRPYEDVFIKEIKPVYVEPVKPAADTTAAVKADTTKAE